MKRAVYYVGGRKGISIHHDEKGAWDWLNRTRLSRNISRSCTVEDVPTREHPRKRRQREDFKPRI